MKFTKPFYWILSLTIVLFLCSCENEEESPILELSDEEAADALQVALSETDGGFMTEVNDLGQEAQAQYNNISTDCNYLTTDSTENSYNGPLRNFSFVSFYQSQASCNTFNIPISLDFTSIRDGIYQGPRLSHQGTGLSSLSLTNLNPLNNEDYTLSGEHSYTGSQTLSTRIQTRTLNTQILITWSDIRIDKQDFTINSGQAVFILEAIGSSGEPILYNGTILFLGNGQAEVTIKGETYPIDIS